MSSGNILTIAGRGVEGLIDGLGEFAYAKSRSDWATISKVVMIAVFVIGVIKLTLFHPFTIATLAGCCYLGLTDDGKILSDIENAASEVGAFVADLVKECFYVAAEIGKLAINATGATISFVATILTEIFSHVHIHYHTDGRYHDWGLGLDPYWGCPRVEHHHHHHLSPRNYYNYWY